MEIEIEFGNTYFEDEDRSDLGMLYGFIAEWLSVAVCEKRLCFEREFPVLELAIGLKSWTRDINHLSNEFFPRFTSTDADGVLFLSRTGERWRVGTVDYEGVKHLADPVTLSEEELVNGIQRFLDRIEIALGSQDIDFEALDRRLHRL